MCSLLSWRFFNVRGSSKWCVCVIWKFSELANAWGLPICRETRVCTCLGVCAYPDPRTRTHEHERPPVADRALPPQAEEATGPRQPRADRCPPPPRSLPPGACQAARCQADSECPRHRRCCYNGCAYACLEAVPPPPGRRPGDGEGRGARARGRGRSRPPQHLPARHRRGRCPLLRRWGRFLIQKRIQVSGFSPWTTFPGPPSAGTPGAPRGQWVLQSPASSRPWTLPPPLPWRSWPRGAGGGDLGPQQSGCGVPRRGEEGGCRLLGSSSLASWSPPRSPPSCKTGLK